MENEEAVVEPQVDQEEQPVTEQPEETPTEETPKDEGYDPVALQEQLNKEVKAREQLTARAKKAEADKRALEAKLGAVEKGEPAPLDVEDYIDISASLDGLDQREKAYLAEQHKLTGKPLKEIRDSEDFQLWDSAYQAKREEERAVAPDTTQELEEGPVTLTQALQGKTPAEKEEILRNAGLYKENKVRSDRTDIGQKISTG